MRYERNKLKRELCMNLCPYYKPSKNNELACRGFLVIERLIKEGREIPLEKSDKRLDDATEKILIQNMCITCSFHENDCDFIQHKGKFLPCGGFILLGHLLEANIIAIDDIIAGSKDERRGDISNG